MIANSIDPGQFQSLEIDFQLRGILDKEQFFLRELPDPQQFIERVADFEAYI